MFNRLEVRSEEDELMDDFTRGGPELKEALRHLRRINRIFGAAGPALYGVKKIWSESGKPRQLSVLDIGCGSGDVNRLLLRWADRSGIRLSITLADITEEACREARELYVHEERVQVVRCDLFHLPECAADVVTATQLVHHFSSDELPRAVASMLQAARMGIVINDIHRHWIAWAAVWLLTRGISRNRYILHDGPLSVAKGFRSAEWRELAQSLGAPKLSYSWRPLFRYAVTARKITGIDSHFAESYGADRAGGCG